MIPDHVEQYLQGEANRKLSEKHGTHSQLIRDEIAKAEARDAEILARVQASESRVRRKNRTVNTALLAVFIAALVWAVWLATQYPFLGD